MTDVVPAGLGTVAAKYRRRSTHDPLRRRDALPGYLFRYVERED